MSNSDTFDYQLSQFGSWYLLAGLEQYLEFADMACQCETLLTELDRLEAWEQQNGGFYGHDGVQAHFADLRQRIGEQMAYIEAIESQHYAEMARAEFRVIEGGLSGNLSQSGIN